MSDSTVPASRRPSPRAQPVDARTEPSRSVRRCQPRHLSSLFVVMASLLVTVALPFVGLAVAGVDISGSGTGSWLAVPLALVYLPGAVIVCLRGVEGTLLITAGRIRYRRALLVPERGWSVSADRIRHVRLAHSGWIVPAGADPASGYFQTRITVETATGCPRVITTRALLRREEVGTYLRDGERHPIPVSETWLPLSDPPVD